MADLARLGHREELEATEGIDVAAAEIGLHHLARLALRFAGLLEDRCLPALEGACDLGAALLDLGGLLCMPRSTLASWGSSSPSNASTFFVAACAAIASPSTSPILLSRFVSSAIGLLGCVCLRHQRVGRPLQRWIRDRRTRAGGNVMPSNKTVDKAAGRAKGAVDKVAKTVKGASKSKSTGKAKGAKK
jgi:hypothetical protein